MRDLVVFLVMLVLQAVATAAPAEPVPVRFREGPSHGFVVLSDAGDKPIAHGELVQWMDGEVVVSNLAFRFDDGSTYDETVRFSQSKVFRVESYELEQRGPSFTETSKVSFDRSGRYDAVLRKATDAEEERASGTVEVPADVMNGMTSIFLKNRIGQGSAAAHLLAFTPQPQVLDVALVAQGSDTYFVGRTERAATRYLIDPKVPDIKGAVATVLGKQPPSFRMWIAQGKAPVLVRFEGPLYADGPTWRIGPTGPRFRE